MDTILPKALTLAAELRAGNWAPNVLQNETALRDRAADELQILHSENESLRTSCDNLRAGYDAARLEITSLRERVQMLGQLARDVNSRRVIELEVEAERLQACLRKSNAQFEHFERGWYLRGDEIESLKAQLEAVGAGGVGPLMAAPAQPVGASRAEFALAALVAAGHVTQSKVDHALALAPQPAAQALDAARVFWQQHTPADALSMEMAELHADAERAIRAALAAPAQAVAPITCKSEQKRLATLWGFVPAVPAQAGEYPALPEPDATTVGLGAVWNRHSMWAYVDADRAARGGA